MWHKHFHEMIHTLWLGFLMWWLKINVTAACLRLKVCSIFLQKEVVQFFKLDGTNPPKSSFDYYCSEQTCETKNICLCLVVLVAGSRYRLEMHFHKKRVILCLEWSYYQILMSAWEGDQRKLWSLDQWQHFSVLERRVGILFRFAAAVS